MGILFGFAILVGWLILQFTLTGSQRWDDFIMGLLNPAESHYQVVRGLEAFVRGGFFGVGLGKGVVKLTGLPVAPTDSIFAVVAEEMGLLGSTLLVLLYVIILWRGLTIALRAPDLMSSLLAGGVTVWVSIEAFVNMAVMLNILPFAGNALPLVSAGGSSYVTTMAGLGILLGVSRYSVEKNELGRFLSAVIDLRRGNRRRRQPRDERASSLD
jgi:cell division protein FtsW